MRDKMKIIAFTDDVQVTYNAVGVEPFKGSNVPCIVFIVVYISFNLLKGQYCRTLIRPRYTQAVEQPADAEIEPLPHVVDRQYGDGPFSKWAILIGNAYIVLKSINRFVDGSVPEIKIMRI